MEEKYVHGHMYRLWEILEIDEPGARYILCGDGERDHVIYFGRGRRFKVPEECYTFIDCDGDYKLEKIIFDETGECNYLKELEKQGIEYSIVRKLPESGNRWFSRLDYAMGCVYEYTHGYIGRNGYAVTYHRMVWDDDGINFSKIDFCRNIGAIQLSGYKVCKLSEYAPFGNEVCKRLLTEKICFEDQESLRALLEEGGNFRRKNWNSLEIIVDVDDDTLGRDFCQA